MTSLVSTVATQRMFVAAAPVAVTARPPLVVSALNASVHPGTLLIAVTVDATRVVLAAVPSRRIKPSIFHAADSVPPEACLRATTIPEKACAELLGKTT
jgi:hypothetical protein